MQNCKVLTRLGGPFMEGECMWKVLTYSEDVFVKYTQMMDGSRSASVSGLLKVALRASVVWLERLASELAPPDKGTSEYGLCHNRPGSGPFAPITNTHGYSLSGPSMSDRPTRSDSAGEGAR
jgi:hypothetical protein